MDYPGIENSITSWALKMGAPAELAQYATSIVSLTVLIAVSITAFMVTKRIALSLLKLFIEKSPTKWDDILAERKFFSRLAALVPAAIIYAAAPVMLQGIPMLVSAAMIAAKLYTIVMLTLAVYSALDTLHIIFGQTRLSTKIAIKGFIQASKLIFFLIAALLCLSVITDKTPIYFLSGLGAIAAILLLIFKDIILGLVAGIQLSLNDMVSEGDWIEMPQFGADGDVIDVSITVVKVQNWDKTITTIPTYALTSQSFKNWRGMQESGGRRIKRSIIINMNSIKFCDNELKEKLSSIQLIGDYVKSRNQEIDSYNIEHKIDEQNLINGRRMTNIGTFRRYTEEYLKAHPSIRQDMTFLVRQLQPTDKGLPLEIYVFCNDQRWAPYESIQADIFDHLLAALPQFELTVFQNPTGADFKELAK